MLRRALALLATLALAACAQRIALTPQSGSQLPGIRTLDSRRPSTVGNLFLNGMQTFSRSGNATDVGTALSLPAHAGSMEWAIYQFNPGSAAKLLSASVAFHAGVSDVAWAAIADFSANHWQFDPAPLPVTLTASAANLSPNGNMYLAVVTEGLHYAQVDAVSISVDNTPPIASFTATPQNGEPGDFAALDAAASNDPDGTIVKYEWDLDGDGTFELDTGAVASTQATLPAAPGSEQVSLRVMDNLGATGTSSLTLTSSTASWQIANPNPDSAGDVGQYPSMAIVDGFPALSYYDNGNGALKYVRASDADGSSWETPLTLDSMGGPYGWNSMAVVNGNPAVSYYAQPNGDLMYIRASDPDGGAWAIPQTLESVGEVGAYPDLAIVDGNPAISYHDITNGVLDYVRASDVDGNTWSAPQLLDSGSGDVGDYTSLAIVGGNPAVSYNDSNFGGLKFIRAIDADGVAWSTPLTLDSGGNIGQDTSLVVVDGNLAISYFDASHVELKYIRATDPAGSGWATPLSLESQADIRSPSSLLVVKGNPAICYYDLGNYDLEYVRAHNPGGSAWGSPQDLDSLGDVGSYPTLAIVNGQPAISYYDYTNGDLKYVRQQ